jgi:hypothetical protein
LDFPNFICMVSVHNSIRIAIDKSC